MPLSNPGSEFNEDGWADVIADIRKLYLMMAGKSNDMNADSKGVSQDVTEIGFPLIANNLSEFNTPEAIRQARQNLQIPVGLPGLTNLNGVPVGGTATATTQTSGSGTHTLTLGKQYCYFRLTGGGGQGGGTPAAADMYGGGGGEGATIWGCIKIDGFTTIAYAVGAGGTGGTSTSNGGDGAASTITVKGVTITASPGLGGTVGGTSFASDAYGHGGDGGAVEYQVGTFYTQWGTSGAMGQPGGYSRRGKAGQTTLSGLGVGPGAGSTGGAQGNAAGAGNAGRVTFYEI